MVRKHSANRPRIHHRVALIMEFSMIPASALEGVPLEGSVADVLDVAVSRIVSEGLRVYKPIVRRK
jgi:hypothetical protein